MEMSEILLWLPSKAKFNSDTSVKQYHLQIVLDFRASNVSLLSVKVFHWFGLRVKLSLR